MIFPTRSRQSVYVKCYIRDNLSVKIFSKKTSRFKTCVFYIICAVQRHPGSSCSCRCVFNSFIPLTCPSVALRPHCLFTVQPAYKHPITQKHTHTHTDAHWPQSNLSYPRNLFNAVIYHEYMMFIVLQELFSNSECCFLSLLCTVLAVALNYSRLRLLLEEKPSSFSLVCGYC